MTTTARKATRRIADDTQMAEWFEIVTAGLLFATCEICDLPAADLYDRLTEDGDEVRACETCVTDHHLGYVAD